MQDQPTVLPVHGFVLAGGKSSRMGRDKALLSIGGESLVEIAVSKLRTFCSGVSISGNRRDLEAFAEIVPEERLDAGPAAGIESGLRSSAQPWSMFLPVDVPFLPAMLLRGWAEAVLLREVEGTRLSCLRVGGKMQPAFCLLHRDCEHPWSKALGEGERKLSLLFERVSENLGPATLSFFDAEDLAVWAQKSDVAGACTAWFRNLNTPDDLAALRGMASEATGDAMRKGRTVSFG